MTLASAFSILLILVLSAVWMLGLAGLQKRRPWNPEGYRKLLHVGSGLMALGLPWLFRTTGPVLILSAASLLAIKGIPALRGLLAGVQGRKSHGELYFASATGLLFLITGGDPFFFSVPMAILTFADSAAALVGQRCGRHRFQAGCGTKTLEGSAAFFFTALISTQLGLQVFADKDPAASLLLALLLALLRPWSKPPPAGGPTIFLSPSRAACFLKYTRTARPPGCCCTS